MHISLNTAEIHTASQKWYLRSNKESEIEEWFKVLHKAAVSFVYMVCMFSQEVQVLEQEMLI